MKLLKRQRGLPFLLALGVLFILSASFLAVQLWSDKDSYRGALHALEAPVMPPAMPKVIAPPPVKKGARKVEPVVAPEVSTTEEAATAPEEKTVKSAAEPVLEPVVEPSVPSIDKAQVQVSEEKPVAVEKSVKVVEPVVSTEKKEVSVKPSVKPAKHETEVAVAPAEKSVAKPAAKPRKSRRKAKVEEIPTEIPPEWNWFSKPLKLNLEPGKARIERADSLKDIRLSEAEKIAVSAVEQVKESEKPAEVASVEPVSVEKVPDEASVSVPETTKPFMMALARMTRIRQTRMSSEVKGAAQTVAPVESMSPSMRSLGQALKALCDKLDRQNPVNGSSVTEATGQAVDAVENLSTDTSVAQNDVRVDEQTAVDHTDAQDAQNGSNEPYVGSGSSFSQRVNMLLKSGLIKAE